MKIAYIHNGFWPSQSPCFTFTTMTALALAGHTEKTYFFIRKNASDPPATILNINFGLPLPPNLKIFPIAGSRVIKAHKFYYDKVYKILKRLIREDQVGAVFSRNVTFLPYLVKIKNQSNIPVYFESHDFFTDLSIREDLSGNRKREMELERKYINQLTGLICLHNTQKDLYQKYFPDLKIIVAGTGLIPAVKERQVAKKYIGYVGSLDKHKGVVQIFKAAALSTTKPSVLIIGGKSVAEVDRFRYLAVKYYDAKKVKITGWVDKKKVNAYLAEIKVGVLPLEDTFFNRYITSPLKLFDFFAHNIPVIAPDIPTMKELITFEKNGLFYDAKNISEMAAAIDTLFINQDLYAFMQNHIEKYKMNITWDMRTKKLIDSMRPDINGKDFSGNNHKK